MIKNCFTFLTVFLSIVVQIAIAQTTPPRTQNPAEIKLALKKMQTMGAVLYVAAHPDDENTRLLGYFANEGYRTGYLSITRGDGGQNLIGKEVREQLGIIRTQELLAARRTDGAEQFFTRANDFGFSKSPQETLAIWDSVQVLADVVWTIRKFRPDIIITRFPKTAEAGHGHHWASAILAETAFRVAGDKNAFPEQLNYVEVWQPKRIFWNNWRPLRPAFAPNDPKKSMEELTKGLIPIDLGKFNVLLGKDYGEIAAESRSQHKSQGFGVPAVRGQRMEYLEDLTPTVFPTTTPLNLANGIKALPFGEAWAEANKVAKLLAKANENFDIENPDKSLSILLEINAEIQKLPNSYWKTQKAAELQNIILNCAGIWCEAVAKNYAVVPNDSLYFSANIIKRGNTNALLKQLEYELVENKQQNAAARTLSLYRPAQNFQNFSPQQQKDLANNLPYNVLQEFKQGVVIPENLPYTEPYWLVQPETKGMFTVNDQELIGLPENPPAMRVKFTVQLGDQTFMVYRPVVYKWTDDVRGELYRNLEIAPPITLNFDQAAYLINDGKPTKLILTVQAQRNNVKGKVKIQTNHPKIFGVTEPEFDLKTKGQVQTVVIEIGSNLTEQKGSATFEIKATAEVEGKMYQQSLKRIDYEHIPIQTQFPDATAKVVVSQVVSKAKNIGYVEGAGDEIPAALSQIGCTVTTITEDIFQNEKALQAFDAVVFGIRAYNTNELLRKYQDKILRYVENGGTVLVQYNTANQISEMVTTNFAPYPLKISRDRVTEEDAAMRILKPEHAVLNTPNKIGSADFEGWVQERGLYFPNSWDAQYEAIFSCNDKGETAKDGSLLVAKYGKGTYIYTGLAFFRQLPAGVAGAYRLFANLISVGK